MMNRELNMKGMNRRELIINLSTSRLISKLLSHMNEYHRDCNHVFRYDEQDTVAI